MIIDDAMGDKKRGYVTQLAPPYLESGVLVVENGKLLIVDTTTTATVATVATAATAASGCHHVLQLFSEAGTVRCQRVNLLAETLVLALKGNRRRFRPLHLARGRVAIAVVATRVPAASLGR